MRSESQLRTELEIEMNPLKTFCLLACLLGSVCATPTHKQSNQRNNNLEPTSWLSTSQLEALPSVDEVTLSQLENMPIEEGAELVQQLYHLAQINNDIVPSFVPSASNIPAYIIKPNGDKVSTTLRQLPQTAQQQPNFGSDELTIFITGLPSDNKDVSKANKKLVQAYQKRYSQQQRQQQQQGNKNNDYDNVNKAQGSSEEDYSEAWSSQQNTQGYLVVIDLGATLTSFKRFAMLDVEKTGDMIGNVIVELENQGAVRETIHVVAQSNSANVAGAAGRQHIRLTGHQLRRITALDPSKVFAKNSNTLTGLARGDAEFVDAIHTSAYGMGVPTRVGDVDFFPNGPSAGVPGADNIIEASMRATRYFAESVIPGNERNFPAVAARSLEEYKSNDGYGKRACMGINTEYDLQGDYFLEVRAHAPFGKSAPAQKQNTYHGKHLSKDY